MGPWSHSESDVIARASLRRSGSAFDDSARRGGVGIARRLRQRREPDVWTCNCEMERDGATQRAWRFALEFGTHAAGGERDAGSGQWRVGTTVGELWR